jgi:hypothetical protein
MNNFLHVSNYKYGKNENISGYISQFDVPKTYTSKNYAQKWSTV